jgi:hypothetical protein
VIGTPPSNIKVKQNGTITSFPPFVFMLW